MLRHVKKFLPWFLSQCLLSAGYGQGAEKKPKEEIIIHGQRSETNRERETGQSIHVTPLRESRQDTRSFLKRESSVSASDTSRISASGFAIPRVRGQDTRLTDVYVENIQIVDPYAGLPLIDDVDVRALGGFDLHLGMTPADMPDLNPMGTIRYRLRNLNRQRAEGGTQFGRPYGTATWGLAQYFRDEPKLESDDSRLDLRTKTNARFYVRHHQTNGKYSYYSDQSTPYNTSDDVYKTRINNDQRSWQAFPYVRHEWGQYILEVMSLEQGSNRGLPTRSEGLGSAARESSRGSIRHLQLGREFATAGPFDVMHVTVGFSEAQDLREAVDPQSQYLNLGEETDHETISHRGLVKADAGNETIKFFVHEQWSQSIIRRKVDQFDSKFVRLAQVTTLSTQLHPGTEQLTLEAKWVDRLHHDRLADLAPAASPTSKLWDGANSSINRARSYGASLAYSPAPWGIYAQNVHTKRLPTLLEQFGDGATIQPNGELGAETIQHHEAGCSVLQDQWQIQLSAFEDATADKIAIVPVSASAQKALQLRRSKIKGMEARSEASIWKSSIALGYTRLFPYDLTQANQPKVLPNVPQNIFIYELDQHLSPRWTMRWLGRYRGQVYRDPANSVLIPAVWIHDLNVDWTSSSRVVSGYEMDVGLSIGNIFDVTSQKIGAPSSPTAQEGRTGYSDVWGDPLPGRTWQLSLAAKI